MLKWELLWSWMLMLQTWMSMSKTKGFKSTCVNKGNRGFTSICWVPYNSPYESGIKNYTQVLSICVAGYRPLQTIQPYPIPVFAGTPMVTDRHWHTLLDAYSVFTSGENYGCQTCVVLYLFFKRPRLSFIWIIFIFVSTNIDKKRINISPLSNIKLEFQLDASHSLALR